MPTFAAMALALVECQGCYVIPLDDEREPLIPLRYASNDPDTVRGWWEEWPDAPVGFVIACEPVRRATDLPSRSNRRLASVPAQIGDGERNTTLTRLAGLMRRAGFSVEAMEAALLQTNRERCHPPLTDREVRTIARSVSRYEAAEEAWHAHLRRAVGA